MVKNVALVTGASSGIGREMALQLAALGHPLLLVARNEAALQEVAQKVRATCDVPAWILPVDLSQPNAAREIFEFTTFQNLEVQVLVNNAGVGHYGEHVAQSSERLSAMLQLNVVALTELSQRFGAAMKERKSGRILNVASTAAYQPTPFFAAYGASKAFVLNFSEALAMELADHGVTVSCLSPGPTETNFFSGIDNGTSHFDQKDDARSVAKIGIDAMLTGKLSTIVGTANYWRAWSARFAPRSVVARMAKGMMAPKNA